MQRQEQEQEREQEGVVKPEPDEVEGEQEDDDEQEAEGEKGKDLEFEDLEGEDDDNDEQIEDEPPYYREPEDEGEDAVEGTTTTQDPTAGNPVQGLVQQDEQRQVVVEQPEVPENVTGPQSKAQEGPVNQPGEQPGEQPGTGEPGRIPPAEVHEDDDGNVAAEGEEAAQDDNGEQEERLEPAPGPSSVAGPSSAGGRFPKTARDAMANIRHAQG